MSNGLSLQSLFNLGIPRPELYHDIVLCSGWAVLAIYEPLCSLGMFRLPKNLVLSLLQNLWDLKILHPHQWHPNRHIPLFSSSTVSKFV